MQNIQSDIVLHMYYFSNQTYLNFLGIFRHTIGWKFIWMYEIMLDNLAHKPLYLDLQSFLTGMYVNK
jgi:hypothetical protein